MNKKIIKRCLLFLAGYLTLLLLLLLVERNTADASIQTLGDAFWYSLVTLTTVGYGDLYPISGIGRIIGAAFVLCSLGLMATILGMIVSLFTGGLMPVLKLWLGRGKHWYVFDEDTAAGKELGSELSKNRDSLVIYCNGQESGTHQISVPFSLEQVIARKHGDMDVFLLGEDGYANYRKAEELASCKVAIYCRTQMDEDLLPENVIRFAPEDALARTYWRQHPITEENCVVIVGSGELAEAILERAVLTNIVDHRVQYHIYGDRESFLREHYALEQVLAIDRTEEDRDSLYFEQEALGSDPKLLRMADRIILCEDDSESNLNLYNYLCEHFPMRGMQHVYGKVSGAECFGDGLYTAENVMGLKLTRLAREMNEIYRNSVDYPAPRWEELTSFYKKSNIASADHLAVKAQLLGCPEDPRAAYAAYLMKSDKEKDVLWKIEHERWMRFYALSNWTYGRKKDPKERTHPLMIPYEELPREEQEKDADAWILLGKVGDCF